VLCWRFLPEGRFLLRERVLSSNCILRIRWVLLKDTYINSHAKRNTDSHFVSDKSTDIHSQDKRTIDSHFVSDKYTDIMHSIHAADEYFTN
jgi:hypothetical protein